LCPLQFHVSDGIVTYIEGDTTGSEEFGEIECRACLRGRSLRRWLNHPDRLKYPLKRVEGTKRGEGEYEQISWDEAIDLFYEKLKYAIETHGNEAIMKLGSIGGTYTGLFGRFMGMNGGWLDLYGTDSHGQGMFAIGYMYSSGAFAETPWIGSMTTHMKDADLIVMFGTSAATSRISGGSCMYDIAIAREAGARFINIDVVLGETNSAHPDEWLPIRPGTDAALASAIGYVLITEGFAKDELLHTYCVGYDEETMPESAKGKNLSYKDYILGTGYDNVAKTPEWASTITQVPVEKIYQLARDIGNAKAAYIGQGIGIQRRSNGENAIRAIAMIPLLSGHFGLPGTSNGLKPATGIGPYVPGVPGGENPLALAISAPSRIAAIDHGDQMTAIHDGVQGAERLSKSVKFVYASATACMANQNPDVNWSASVLEDESKAEFIVGSDFFLTSSMRYCDLILPGVMPPEQFRLPMILSGGSLSGLVYGQPVQEAPFECKTEYEWMTDLAERFGMKEQFTEGKTEEEWTREGYDTVTLAMVPDLPALEDGLEMGYWFVPSESKPAFAEFREDPVANPLPTPSGKIEVYSEAIAGIAATWVLDDPRDIISPIPIYNPGVESYLDATDEYPLLVSSWKAKTRYQSKFNQIELLNQASRHTVWINPLDAEPRGINNGDMVRVFNGRGEMHIEARVTPRVVPGAVAMAHGKMRELDENGVDIGGQVNTLTMHHLSPGAKHNNSNSILAQVEKL
jgi:DmsA/YnfE family anaerobic dimethyl sulfoxide reductase A subunit